MKNYGVYIYRGFHAHGSFHAFLRYGTDNLEEAKAKAREIEETSTEEFEGTALYDTHQRTWFDMHERKEN